MAHGKAQKGKMCKIITTVMVIMAIDIASREAAVVASSNTALE